MCAHFGIHDLDLTSNGNGVEFHGELAESNQSTITISTSIAEFKL
jgi:hypothetical protein